MCRVSGYLNKWIEDFVNCRSQRVVCNEENSDWALVLSDIPQGKVIGPLLFLIYSNDLLEEVGIRVRLFADDIIGLLCKTIIHPNDATSLQHDLNKLAF